MRTHHYLQHTASQFPDLLRKGAFLTKRHACTHATLRRLHGARVAYVRVAGTQPLNPFGTSKSATGATAASVSSAVYEQHERTLRAVNSTGRVIFAPLPWDSFFTVTRGTTLCHPSSTQLPLLKLVKLPLRSPQERLKPSNLHRPVVERTAWVNVLI